MDYFFLYLLGQDIRSVLGGILFGMGSVMFMYSLVSSIAYEKVILPKGYIITIFSIVSVIALLTPSQDSLKYMGSYYVGKQAIQSETTQKLITILNQRLDKEIQDNLIKKND